MSDPYHRYRLFPAYKANRRGGTRVRKRAPAPKVERRPLANNAPELKFSFALPGDLGWSVAPGPVDGIACAEVDVAGIVVIRGHFPRDEILRKAAQVLRLIAPRGYWTKSPIEGRLEAAPHAGSTVSGPMVPGWSEALCISIVSDASPAIVISKSAARPLIIGKAMQWFLIIAIGGAIVGMPTKTQPADFQLLMPSFESRWSAMEFEQHETLLSRPVIQPGRAWSWTMSSANSTPKSDRKTVRLKR